MRSHILTKTFNTLLFLSAICLIMFSYNKLFIQNNFNSINSNLIVGKINLFRNTVQYKSTNNLQWDFITKLNKSVAENDAIFTHTDSEVNIAFKSSQEVLLKSESLLRIKSPDEIQLQKGELELNLKAGAKPFSLQIGKEKYKIKATKDSIVKINKTLNSKNLSIKSGSISLTDQQMNKVSASAGEKVELTSKKLNVSSNQIQLISPKGIVYKRVRDKTEFAYNTSLPVKRIQLTRADRSFTLIPGQKINLKPERYQWKLILEDQRVISPVENFDLIKLVSAPELIYPMNDFQYIAYSLPISMTFRWKSIAPVILDISSKNTTYKSKLSSMNETTVDFDQPGTYFWKTKVNGNFIQSPYNLARKIHIDYINPENEAVLKIELRKPNQLARFQWSNPSKGKNKFILAKDPTFKTILKSIKSTSDNVSVGLKELGTYYWKVESEGKIVPQKVIITPTPPPSKAPKVKNIKQKIKAKKTSLLYQVFNLIIPSAHAAPELEKVPIKWEKIEDAKSYEIEIYRNNSLKPIEVIQSRKNHIKWSPPGIGTYSYRVRYKDFWDRFSPFSQKAKLQLLADDLLKKKKHEVKSPPPVKAKVAKKLKPKPPSKPSRPELSLYYISSTIDYLQQDSDSYSIEGQSNTGHGLYYKSNWSWKMISPDISYTSQYGNVFDEQQFYLRQIDLLLSYPVPYLDFALVLSSLNVSSYETQNSSAKFSSGDQINSIGLRLSKTQKIGTNHDFSIYFIYKGGQFSETSFGINYEYYWKEVFSPLFGVKKSTFDINTSDLDLSLESFQILVGFKSYL